MTSIKWAFILLAMSFSFTGCEGFKILTLYNKTGKAIVVETRPELSHFKRISPADTAQNLAASKIYKLLPDSSMSLLTSFGALIFQVKIREQDLPINYLRIETPTDKIVAENRVAIIKLVNNPKVKYKRSDKSFAKDNNRNIEAIILRQ